MPSTIDDSLPPILLDMLASGQTVTETGSPMNVKSEIPLAFAQTLNRVVADWCPSVALEIGMACGVSTLAMLSGTERSQATVISIDPGQSWHYHGAGRAIVERSGLGTRHRHIEDYDYVALPMLLSEGVRVQVAYIDGMHTFDHVLLDFFYVDKLLDVGGVVGFNDCAYPAVHKGIGFLKTHRAYAELDVGLGRNWTGTSHLETLRRRRQRRYNADRYFVKTADHAPADGFFADF